MNIETRVYCGRMNIMLRHVALIYVPKRNTLFIGYNLRHSDLLSKIGIAWWFGKYGKTIWDEECHDAEIHIQKYGELGCIGRLTIDKVDWRNTPQYLRKDIARAARKRFMWYNGIFRFRRIWIPLKGTFS